MRTRARYGLQSCICHHHHNDNNPGMQINQQLLSGATSWWKTRMFCEGRPVHTKGGRLNSVSRTRRASGSALPYRGPRHFLHARRHVNHRTTSYATTSTDVVFMLIRVPQRNRSLLEAAHLDCLQHILISTVVALT